MTYIIQARRGNAADRPTLNPGEFGLDTDTDDLWIGTPTGNLKVYPPVPRGDPALFGTPVAGEFTYWHSSTEVTGNPNVTWDSGNTRLALGSTVGLQWTGKSIVTSPDNGSLRLTNSAANDSRGIFFGPSTAAFPFLERDSAGLRVRTGDELGYGDFAAGTLTAHDVVAFPERGTIPGSIVGTGQLYAKSSDKKLYYQDGDGNEFDITEPGVTGTATAGQIAFWDGVDSIAGDGGLLYDSTTDLLQFGGTTSAFPALARDGATSTLLVRNADNTADAALKTGTLISTDPTAGVRVDVAGQFWFNGSTKLEAPSDGDLLLTNYAGTDVGLLMFGGTGSSFPALGNNAGILDVKRADNSGRARLLALELYSETNVRAGASFVFHFTGSTKLSAPSDGQLLLTNDAGTDFGLLQFGGTGSGNVALKPVGTTLNVRTGDDLAYATLVGSNISALSNLAAGATGAIYWSARTQMFAPVDGNLLLRDNAGTDFGLLQFGGTGAGNVALKPVGTTLNVRTGDDSGAASLAANNINASGWSFGNSYVFTSSGGYLGWQSRSRMYSDADGDIRLTDAAGTSFTSLVFGTADASHVMLKTGTNLEIKTADDLSFATVSLGTLIASNYVSIGNPQSYRWTNRSRLYSDADGSIRLTDNAGTSFTSLVFGQATASFPMWKVSGNSFHARLGDDTNFTTIQCGNLIAGGSVTTAAAEYFGWSGRARLYSPSTSQVNVRNSGDTDYANLACENLYVYGNARVEAGSYYSWNGRSLIYSDSDGSIRLTDAAGTDFTSLIFGQATASFPMWVRNGVTFEARTADNSGRTSVLVSDLELGAGNNLRWLGRARLYSSGVAAIEARNSDNSNYAQLTVAGLVANSDVNTTSTASYRWSSRTRLYAPADGDLQILDSAETGVGSLIFGQATASFPMLKRNGVTLEVKTANGATWANVDANVFNARGRVAIASTQYLHWQNQSRLYSDADGNIRLTDDAGTDFGLLQFGGTSASFPAWKRNAAKLEARLASDIGRTDVLVSNLEAGGYVLVGSTEAFQWNGRSHLYSPADGAVEFAASGGTGTACYQELNEFASGSDPAAPGSNKARFYIRDNGAGKGQLCVRFATGAVQVIATEP